MKKLFKILIVVLLLIGIAAASTIYIKNSNIAVLEPKGLIAEKERDLIITASELMLIVVIPVFFMTFYFAWRYREGKGSAHTPDWEHNAIAEYFWWGVPIVIIICLAVITWKSSFELSPFKPIQSTKKGIVIQAVALQWKWFFIYPEEGIATVNYIQFPVDTTVKFEITADAPMNSFWIPQLGGQIYAMPAMRSTLNLIANQIGSYRGLSSNISGTGFAGMTFEAKVTSDSDFNRWVSSVKSSSQGFGKKEYENLVKPTMNVPASTYVLKDKGLFDSILMKYMAPGN